MKRALPILAAFAASACSNLEVEEIALRLSVEGQHRCEGAGLAGVFAVKIRMARRNDTQAPVYAHCVETKGIYGKLSELQEKLSRGDKPLVFGAVQPGLWDIWVAGTDAYDCSKPVSQIRLCGTAPIVVPPLSAEVVVPVDCEDPLSDQSTIEAIKKRINDCRIGMPFLN